HIQRIKPQIVAVRSRWRTWTHVPDHAKVVLSLNPSPRDTLILRHIRLERSNARRNIVHDPVCESSWLGSIRIVHDQRKGFCLSWSIAPCQFRRDVISITGELERNRSFMPKRCTRKLHVAPPDIVDASYISPVDHSCR